MLCTRICAALMLATLIAGHLSASEPKAENPVTLEGLRALVATGSEFSRCTSGQIPKQCWTCQSHGCGYSEELAFNGWSVSSSAYVVTDRDEVQCSVSAESMYISISHLLNHPRITIQIPGRKPITLHEARPVYLYVDGTRFTNPEDGPYLKMEFRDEEGAIVDPHALIDRMQSANRIAVDVWNVNDEKVSTVEFGEGLARAIDHCERFAEKTAAAGE